MKVAIVVIEMRAELVNFVIRVLDVGFGLELINIASETRGQARDVLLMGT